MTTLVADGLNAFDSGLVIKIIATRRFNNDVGMKGSTESLLKTCSGFGRAIENGEVVYQYGRSERLEMEVERQNNLNVRCKKSL